MHGPDLKIKSTQTLIFLFSACFRPSDADPDAPSGRAMLPPGGRSSQLRLTPDKEPKRQSQREPEVTHTGQRFPRKLCWRQSSHAQTVHVQSQRPSHVHAPRGCAGRLVFAAGCTCPCFSVFHRLRQLLPLARHQ